jgi:hypothetical protein
MARLKSDRKALEQVAKVALSLFNCSMKGFPGFIGRKHG